MSLEPLSAFEIDPARHRRRRHRALEWPQAGPQLPQTSSLRSLCTEVRLLQLHLQESELPGLADRLTPLLQELLCLVPDV